MNPENPEKTYKFKVVMSCTGCSGAVDRALKKLDGIDKVDISMENQTVFVTTKTATYDEVLEKIQKTGKTVTAMES